MSKKTADLYRHCARIVHNGGWLQDCREYLASKGNQFEASDYYQSFLGTFGWRLDKSYDGPEHLILAFLMMAAIEENPPEPQRELKWAISIFNKIEYSRDGFPKRYPDEKDYSRALEIIQILGERND